MANITVAKALKIRKRLVGQLNELDVKLMSVNTYMEDEADQRPYTTAGLLAERRMCMTDLIEIKTAIANANSKIASTLASLAELKSYLTCLNRISTTQGFYSGFNDSSAPRRKVAEVTAPELANLIKDVTSQINQHQDSIDESNATIKVEISDAFLERNK